MHLREALKADLHANDGGVGAKAALYAILINPGFSTIAVHRLATALRSRGHRRLSAMVWSFNTFRTGCHFHLDSEIGPGLTLPHPIGVVIGSGARIESGVCLYHGVTLGRAGDGGYPVVREGAVLYPHAVVIGGVEIGRRAIVGATALVRTNVPADTIVDVQPVHQLRPRSVSDDRNS